MKFSLFTLLFVLCLPLCAQKTTSKTTQTTTISSGEYNLIGRHSDVVTHGGKVDSHSSTNRSKTSLTFTADFKAIKQSSIKRLLLNRLDDGDLKRAGDTYRWRRATGGAAYFSCSLSEGRLRLNVDRTVAPVRFYNRIDTLCSDLVEVIASHEEHFSQAYGAQSRGTSKTSTTTSNAEEELQRALRELDAAREKVERLGKKVDKQKKKQ